MGASGVSGDDVGSAVGLFLTIAQSSIALGVASIGGVFFSYLSDPLALESYRIALTAALTCNVNLQGASLLLALGLIGRTGLRRLLREPIDPGRA